MQLLPIALPIGLTVNAMTFAVSPWGVPAFAGMVGATAANEPTLVVGFETPSSWIRLSEPLDKPTLETILVRRYSLDQRLATGTHAFAAVQPGSDPPDVIAQTDSGPLGVESTALAIESRREVHGLFLALRQRLIMTEPVALAKLAGYFVYVWFEAPAPTALDKPHRRSDDAAIQALVEELKTYAPQHQQLWVPEGPLPPQAPPLPTATTPAGAKFYAVPFAGGVPGTMLFAFSGFEIGLAYTTLLTAQEAWDLVQKLVDDHDRPGVDVLLITAGGPNVHGNVFPAEETVGDFLVTYPLGLIREPTHITTVVLHSWATGRATVLHPKVEPAFGPLYQSAVPTHHPLATRGA
jgi:hypothetical protein